MQISNKNLHLYITMLLVFLCLVLTTIFLPLQQDEGVFLTIAEGLKNGLLPYRDFFDHKPPAIYLLFSLLTLFTTKIIFFKLLLITSHLISLFLIFLTSQKLKISGHYAVLLYLSLILIFEGQRMIAEPFGALFLLFGLYVYLSRKKPTSVLLAGFLVGISILFKQTFLFSFLALLIYFVSQKKYKDLLLVIAGALIPIIVTILWLWSLGLLSPAYQQVILYNFKFYPSENIFKVIRLLAPSFLHTLPIWVLFGSAIFKLLRRSQDKRTHHNVNKSDHLSSVVWQIRHPLLLIALLATLPIFLFFGRHYLHYWLQVAPFVTIVASSNLRSGFRTKFDKILLVFILISCLIFSYNFWHRNYPKYLAEHKIINFLKHKNKPIYAENQFTGIYFLTGSQPPNKYLYITEISDWSEQAEEKTIETLKRSEHLIVWPADSNYPYAKTLQRYIFEAYKPIYWGSNLGVVVYTQQMDDKSN